MIELLSHIQMQHALLAVLLSGIACGIIGSLIVTNRLVFMAGGIAHTAYGGVGLAVFASWPVLPTTLGFTFLASLGLAAITVNKRINSDVMIGVMWAAGMTFGVILLNLTSINNVDLASYLFGNVMNVSLDQLWLMFALIILILAIVIYFYRDLHMMSFDPEYALSRGVAVKPLYVLLLVMAAISIVIVIQVVGLIMVIALLTIPPFIAQQLTKSLSAMMMQASLWGIAAGVLGLVVAHYTGINAGASIVAVAVVCFLMVQLIVIAKR